MGTLGSFSVLWTGDGSPSLRGEAEPMHHLGGAYAETQYIYGDAIRQLAHWPELMEWKVLVVGLGLGYIELLATAEALKNQKPLRLLSYEIKSELVENFLNWLGGRNSNLEASTVYDRLYAFFQTDYPGLNIKQKLFESYKDGSWEIRGALEPSSLPLSPYQALLFDAFSGKSTPDLWTEEFLLQFAQAAASTPSVFATYACTGTLRRTLQAAGFDVEKRPGFQGKRDSTKAIKMASSLNLN